MHGKHLNNLLKKLVSKGRECEWVEFKENNSNPEMIGEYLSALSNSAFLLDEPYGYLVYGVNDSLEVVGTNFNFFEAKVGNEPLENWLSHNLDPRIDFQASGLESNNKRVVIIRVDSTRLKPVSFRGVEFVRIGSVKKKLKEHPEKERKIWEKTSKTSFENLSAKDNVSSDEVLSLINYPKYFDMMNLPLPQNKDGIILRLKEESIIRDNNIGTYDITNLGAILFAKDLHSFPELERKALRVVIYKGKNRIVTLKEHLVSSGYAVGFEGAMGYINDQLPSNEVIGQALRETVKMYPELAIRELVANTLIHQDFTIKGTGPMVEIFDDRIEISNAGSPLVDTLRLIDHKPISRNEKLAYLMRRLKICEERGTGIDKVINEIESYQLPAPRFTQEESYFRAIIYAHKTLRQMNKEDKTRACYQHSCLQYVSNEVMTNESLRNRFNISEANYSIASRIIADTLAANLIKPSDPESKSKKNASYLPFWA